MDTKPEQAVFENYEILRRSDGSLWELGRGAMGVTYKAVDQNLQCPVALKLINSTFLDSDEAVQRFYREARSAARLRHPNIATIYHLGKGEDGSPFYAMEFCEGPTLEGLVDWKGPLDSAQAFEITLQIARALAIAEEHHVVHRDLKPANLIVSQRGDEATVVKVIDFGLAKMGGDNSTSVWSSLSGAGFVGTAHFSSPEQIEGGPVDTRSDIYSLGATLFYMLTGKPLFEGSAARIISQHLTRVPPFEILPPLPPGGLELIRSMLAKEPEQRPQGAHALRQQIEAVINGAPPKSVAPAPPPLPISSQLRPAAPQSHTTPPPMLAAQPAPTPAPTQAPTTPPPFLVAQPAPAPAPTPTEPKTPTTPPNILVAQPAPAPAPTPTEPKAPTTPPPFLVAQPAPAPAPTPTEPKAPTTPPPFLVAQPAPAPAPTPTEPKAPTTPPPFLVAQSAPAPAPTPTEPKTPTTPPPFLVAQPAPSPAPPTAEAAAKTGPPTLMDLMKARGVLSPAEALQLATSLAAAVDANPEGSLILTKQAITFHWDPGLDPAAQRGYLHRPLAEWPAFRVEAEKLSNEEQRALPTSGQDTTLPGGTIVPGMNNSGGSIGALAALIYEMVGGTPSHRYVPVARLSESQNMVLQRAISAGAVIYEKAADLIAKLKTESLDSYITPPPPNPLSPHDSQPATPARPLPQPPPPLRPAFPPGIARPPQARQPDPATKHSAGRKLLILGAVPLLLVLALGAFDLLSDGTKSDTTPTPANNNPALNPQQLADTNPPKIDPNQISQLTGGNNNTSDAFKKLREAIAKEKLNPKNLAPIPLPQPNPAENLNNNNLKPTTDQQGKVSFTLVDDLSSNQFSEDIAVFVNGQPLGGAKTRLHVDRTNPHDSLVVICNKPGVYTVTAQATTIFFGGPSGTFRSNGTGASGPMNIHGGETLRFSIQNFTSPDYTTYNFAIAP